MGTRKMHIIIDKIFLSSKFKIVSTVDHSWAWAVYNLGSNHSLSHYYRDEFWQGTWNLPLFLSWFSARGNSENCSLQIHCHLSAATFCGIHSGVRLLQYFHTGLLHWMSQELSQDQHQRNLHPVGHIVSEVDARLQNRSIKEFLSIHFWF